MSQSLEKATLLLEDGTRWEGYAAGARTTQAGELCFNTGMSGYQEIFTDPSYYGQVIVMTHTHIGNYGTIAADSESDRIQINALICRNFSDYASRSGAVTPLEEYLKAGKVPAIYGVDTRALVRHIRARGAMNAVVSTEEISDRELQAALEACPTMHGLELASVVSTPENYVLTPENPVDGLRVAVYDFGTKQNILRSLTQRGCTCQVFPAKTPAEDVLATEPDGFFLSNGPGDPAAMDYAITNTKALLKSGKPLFGICMGHQILGEALGAPTYKMPYGHRGINHAVKNLTTGRSEITTQNHGFSVDASAIDANSLVEITHRNLNDNSVAGIRAKAFPAFSVQYHPEANPGPHDGRYLFDQFVELMKMQKATP